MRDSLILKITNLNFIESGLLNNNEFSKNIKFKRDFTIHTPGGLN
jgi:hypothetical protein